MHNNFGLASPIPVLFVVLFLRFGCGFFTRLFVIMFFRDLAVFLQEYYVFFWLILGFLVLGISCDVE
jgi:hypothetical protein